MTTRHILSNVMRPLIAAACLLVGTGCGSELLRTGRAPVILIIQQLSAAGGDDPGTFANPLLSDVQNVVDDVPTIFNDLGRATLRAELKDQSGAIVRDPLNPVTAPTAT